MRTTTGVLRRLIAGAVALAVALAAGACARAAVPTSPSGSARISVTYAAAASPDSPVLSGAKAINAFGFDLMRACATEATSPAKNVVLSPLSAHAALSMALQGARGETADQMARTLHIPGDANSVAESYSMLRSALAQRSREQTLAVADAMWIDQRLNPHTEFMNANRIAFGASARTLDFQQADVAGIVNHWAAEKTYGMITHVLDRIDPSDVMILANAVYFQGRWTEPFEPRATRAQPFHRSDGTVVEPQMMHGVRDLPIVAGDGYRATELPYRGDDSMAVLILPDSSKGLSSVLASMSASGFSALLGKLASRPGTSTALALPKFDTTQAQHLSDTLASMGMPLAFDRDRADFSGIATPTPDIPNLYIAQVTQVARVQVDEKKTTAAAVTTVEMGSGAALARQPEPVPFVCDHPFAFAIVDRPTGAVTFLAEVRDPTAK